MIFGTDPHYSNPELFVVIIGMLSVYATLLWVMFGD
jgi:hypothetical protein